jgi:branched-chain amino acid transport system substrate-binding protein
MRKFTVALPLVALAGAVAATAALARPAESTAPAAASASSQAVRCNTTLRIAIVTPLTGGAGFLGQDQLSWARYAVKTIPRTLGLRVQLVTGDTPVEQGAAPAQTLAQRYANDRRVVGVIGPATSGAVAASSRTFFAAGLAHISPSATRTSLTQGATKEATPGFFRVVPGDYIQGPSVARFMINNLRVTRVVILDFQEPYSLGLADSVEATLKRGNVTTSRLSVPNTVTDFSSYVTRVPNDADIVFFPTQKPADAQTFARQLVEQGKRARVFGADGSNDPDQFKTPGAYVSNFAPDITGIATSRSLVSGWRRDNPGKTLGSFGPPAYGATQVLLHAIKRACNAGNGTIPSKRHVLRQVKRVRVNNWILGGQFRWSTKTNDPLNAKFYIFQIQPNGTYKLVG